MGSFILLEIVTLGLSIIIEFKGAIDGLISLAEDGYIVDKNRFFEKQKNGTLKTKKKNKLLNTLGFICFFIPGVNVIYSSIEAINLKKDFKRKILDNDVYIKISDHKIELLNSIDSTITKAAYIGNLIEDKEVVAVNNSRVFTVDTDNLKLKYDKLEPIEYSLNDVKELNNITGYTYRVGTMDNDNVAIIGIPSSSTKVEKVNFRDETFMQYHMFEEMDLDDAKYKKFTVYPYTWEERFENDIHKSIEKMKKVRNNNIEDSNNYYDDNLYEDIIPQKEQNGPVLSRRLKK